MKNLSLILNGVLIVAVAVLYFLQFKSSSDEVAVESEEAVEEAIGPLTVAYVNSDSLAANYKLFEEKEEQLEKRRVELESQFQTRVKGLEQEIATFQRTANTMTIGQARAVEENLQKKQQNLLVHRDQLNQSLLLEEQDAQNEIYDKITKFVKRYSEENDYHIVLGIQRGSGILFANQGLEITKEVVEGLNKEYLEPESLTQPADSIQ